MRHVLALLSAGLLCGCAGYAADYWKPKERLIAAQLVRYGMAGNRGQCVERGLTASLSVWQLRQLADLAARLTPGGANPAALGPWEFIYIAGLVQDPKVEPATRRALDGCSIALHAVQPSMAAASPSAPVRTGETSSANTPPSSAPSAQSQPLWVNLGAAQTGQGIAVDAATVTRGPSWRQAWFRLLNWDRAGTADVGYLLRIDCSAKAITAHAGRKYAPGGGLIEQRDYATPEGPMSIESGTVIEVAYHALCDQPD